MSKTARYKTLYGNPNDNGDITITQEGKVTLPAWLALLLIHNSGLRSSKKRLVKKRLKREVMKAIQAEAASQD
jgi:hypothetical protein